MKLIIMIPCLNEEETLPLVLQDIPKRIDGVDSIEVLIIDDGCTDRTVEVARAMGVQHFVHHRKNQGLIDWALKQSQAAYLTLGSRK